MKTNYSQLWTLGSLPSKIDREGSVIPWTQMGGCCFDNRNVNNHNEDKEEQLREGMWPQ